MNIYLNIYEEPRYYDPLDTNIMNYYKFGNLDIINTLAKFAIIIGIVYLTILILTILFPPANYVSSNIKGIVLDILKSLYVHNLVEHDVIT
jgi:hypothetical protein